MDAIQAVLDLVKTKNALEEQIEEYEEWFEALVGKTVSYAYKPKKGKIRYVDCEVDEWDSENGCWTLVSIEGKEGEKCETFDATFEDFCEGRLWITQGEDDEDDDEE
jgi:hypothetical protein